MKKLGLLTLIFATLLTSCSDGSTSKKGETSETNTNPVSEPNNTTNNVGTSGPTGTVDPVDPSTNPNSGEVTYYDDPFDDNTPQLPGTAVEVCGVMYKQLNDSKVYLDDDGTIYEVKQYSYESEIFLRTFNFPNDANDICTSAYRANENGAMVLYLNDLMETTAIANPTRLLVNDFSYELCGDFKVYTSFSGNSYWQIKVNSVDYIVQNPNMLELPPLPVNGTVKACVYANSNFYYDYGVSFKRLFNVEAMDFGTYNPIEE